MITALDKPSNRVPRNSRWRLQKKGDVTKERCVRYFEKMRKLYPDANSDKLRGLIEGRRPKLVKRQGYGAALYDRLLRQYIDQLYQVELTKKSQ